MKIPTNWTFQSKEVADGFDSHVREQLPWYDLATFSVAHIARHYIPEGGTVLDLGASTGNIGRAISETLEDRNANLIAIDRSKEMCDLYEGAGKIECADLFMPYVSPCRRKKESFRKAHIKNKVRRGNYII